MNMDDLTLRQRIRRRFALWGGTYTWPDGYLELDIDAKAGITRAETSEDQHRKLGQLAAREKFWQRLFGISFLSIAAYLVADHLRMEHPIVIAALVGFGAFNLSR